MPSCVAVANRHAGRLAIGPQVNNLPHNVWILLLVAQDAGEEVAAAGGMLRGQEQPLQTLA